MGSVFVRLKFTFKSTKLRFCVLWLLVLALNQVGRIGCLGKPFCLLDGSQLDPLVCSFFLGFQLRLLFVFQLYDTLLKASHCVRCIGVSFLRFGHFLEELDVKVEALVTIKKRGWIENFS